MQHYFGASTSTPNIEVQLNLRKELDVYANLRPIKSYRGVGSMKVIILTF